jgi:hypothetical protein
LPGKEGGTILFGCRESLAAVDDDSLVGGQLQCLHDLDDLVFQRMEVDLQWPTLMLLAAILELNHHVFTLRSDEPADCLGVQRGMDKRIECHLAGPESTLETPVSVHNVHTLLLRGDIALVLYDLDV